MLVAPDGSLFISDDKAGVIYRLAPAKGINIGSFKIVPVTPLVDYWPTTGGTVALQNRAVVWIQHRGRNSRAAIPRGRSQYVLRCPGDFGRRGW